MRRRPDSLSSPRAFSAAHAGAVATADAAPDAEAHASTVAVAFGKTNAAPDARAVDGNSFENNTMKPAKKTKYL